METSNHTDRIGLLLRKWSIVILIALAFTGRTQSVQSIGQPKWKSPFVIVLAEKGNETLSLKVLKEYQDLRGTSFVWLEMESAGNEVMVVNSINQLLNDSTGIDMQRVYLIISGSAKFVDKFQFLTTSLFFSNHQIFENSDPVSEEALRQVVDELSEKYLWDIRLDQIRNDQVSDLRQNSVRSGLSFNMNTIVPFYDGFEAKLKPVFNSYGIGVYHQWSARWQALINFSASLNIPSRGKMQREVSAAIFGEEDEVDIDILAHVLMTVNLEARYLLPDWNQKVRPYLGFHVGYSSFRVAENTIEVDPSDLAGGSISRPEGFERIDFEEISGLNAGVSSGLYYQSNPKWRADFGLKWMQDTNTGPYLNQLSLSVGLQFRFAKRKELFYNYVSYDQ